MAGYRAYSMSNNAVDAYNHGQMPISKWTKKALLENLEDIWGADSNDKRMVLAQKLTREELQDNTLTYCGWHHTSCKYNRTDFYEMDENYIQSITADDLQDVIERRKPRKKRSPEEIAMIKQKKAEAKAAKQALEEKAKLFKYQTQCKTLNGFMRSTRQDLDELRKKRQAAIAIKREELTRIWEREGRYERIELLKNDEFVESYIR